MSKHSPPARPRMLRSNFVSAFPRVLWLIVAVALILPVIALSQGAIRSLMVAGGAGSIPVTQMNGKNYVEVEALARAANGSLSYQGNQMTLSLSNSAGASPAPSTAAGSAFSPDFLRAGIEAMSTIREWHSVLASAIENGYPITRDGLASYQGQAATSVRLAQAAASTDGDQSAAQLIAAGFQKMKQLSDKYTDKRMKMNYVDPDALKNDPADQSLIACGRALGAMAASRQFTDDPACH